MVAQTIAGEPHSACRQYDANSSSRTRKSGVWTCPSVALPKARLRREYEGRRIRNTAELFVGLFDRDVRSGRIRADQKAGRVWTLVNGRE